MTQFPLLVLPQPAYMLNNFLLSHFEERVVILEFTPLLNDVKLINRLSLSIDISTLIIIYHQYRLFIFRSYYYNHRSSYTRYTTICS